MTMPLHIIEPTLEGEAGHCFSFVNSLCSAAGDHPITVWCGRRAFVSFPAGVHIKRLFYRRLRRIQAWWLYRTLLKQPGRIFVATGGRTDLVLLHLAASGSIPADKVYLYVHWFRTSPAKRRQLEKLAARQPGITIFAPTASVCEEFRAAGFGHTRHVPYPITPLASPVPSEGSRGFSHVLFAGAARHDKGFSDVVTFVELLAATGRCIPVSLQTSAQNYDKIDEATSTGLSRLERLDYPHLRRYADTLEQGDYRALFNGAICLQLYSRQDFADRISGVTLDALSMGSPVVTLAGTWIARVVSEFDAGLVLESPAPEAVLAAVTRIMANYEQYCRHALEAGRELQKRNSAAVLFRELMA
jgi:hypothetical protein